MKTPTPETDAAQEVSATLSLAGYFVAIGEICRKLERERDQARAEVDRLTRQNELFRGETRICLAR